MSQQTRPKSSWELRAEKAEAECAALRKERDEKDAAITRAYLEGNEAVRSVLMTVCDPDKSSHVRDAALYGLWRQRAEAAEAEVLRLQAQVRETRRQRDELAEAGPRMQHAINAACLRLDIDREPLWVAILEALDPATTAPGGAPSKPTRAEVVALLAEGKRNADAACGPEDAAPPALPRVRFGAGGAPSPAPSAAEEPR